MTVKNYLLGGVVALIILVYLNRDILPSIPVSDPVGPGFGTHGPSDYYQPTPTPMGQYGEFNYTCINDSNNKEYCECAWDEILKAGGYEDIPGVRLYQETKDSLSEICLIRG
ncbi:MAG: hypothetical protein NUV98_07305 [Candidatus Roizmanbacteria bacterium]|nr:hypothetical protein [Candidatus Roizmanbacteria bacterium]